MKYTTLLLDLDNTLLDFNKAEYHAIKAVLKKYSLPFSDDIASLYSEINLKYWKRFEKGEIEKKDIFENRFIELFSVLGESRDEKAFSKDYFAFLSEGYYTVDGAEDLLKYLKDKGYYLVAATNGVSLTQHKRIRLSGLEKYFYKVFVSEDTGHQKPEKEYYDYIINNIPEKDKQRLLIVGDSQSSDILGGINSMIDTCWYNPKDQKPTYKSTYVITDLSELKNIL